MKKLLKKIRDPYHKNTPLSLNLGVMDIMIRFVILMVFVIVGGLLHSIPVMLLGLPFFFTAILGWCPVFKMLGINHHTPEYGMY